MSENKIDKSSVFSKGGGGTNFEQFVQTGFLVSMLVKGGVPGIPDSRLVEMKLQTTRLGYATDDLFMKCTSPLGEHRVLGQVKHAFSFTANDETFKDVMRQLWSDFKNADLFNPALDKFFIIKSSLTKKEHEDVRSVVNWAKSKKSAEDFILEVERINSKKGVLDIFRTVIKEISGQDIEDDELWTFCKCIQILSYDFGNHDSEQLTQCLNLLKLAKRPEAVTTEGQLWSQLFEFVALRNTHGGSFDYDSLTRELFFTSFKDRSLESCYKALEKLEKDADVILGQFSSEIDGFHIERPDLEKQLLDSVNNHKLTLVTGLPGVGKSAVIKDVLKYGFPAMQLFVFRADQLNQPHLANVLSSVGIQETLENILSSRALYPETVIYIDAAEKLLEGENENAFKQLYEFAGKHPHIKLIASSRKYAVELLCLKYRLDRSVTHLVEVQPLTDIELDLVVQKFPRLKTLLVNEKIKSLLRCPKYIDYALLLLSRDNSDYSTISLTQFKNRLWEYIVENRTNRRQGMPARRGNAFSSIAVERAKKMSLFVESSQLDYEAAAELEADNMIVGNGFYQYTPSHDILEDWALVRYIEHIYQENTDPTDFFHTIGHEPAVRRAFRLWIEDYLRDRNDYIIRLIENSLENEEIEKYWSDEILTAIFRADNCEFFFSTFESTLLEADAVLLKRCIHILRVACKEASVDNPTILIPIGSGWYFLLKFIAGNISSFNHLRPLIFSLIQDMQIGILCKRSTVEEICFVKEIIIHYLEQIQAQDEFWKSYLNRNNSDLFLEILFSIAPLVRDYISGLIDAALKPKAGINSDLRRFYEKVLDLCLSGIHSKGVVQEFPDKICEIAWQAWKYVEPERNPSRLSFYIPSPLSLNTAFGLKDNIRKEFPAGIYKTPFWNMLSVHPYKAFDFILEFTNYCVDNYAQSGYLLQEGEMAEIEIKWKRKRIKQIGTAPLWCAYRGTWYAYPYVFQSILVSLEKYLLTVAGQKTEESRQKIQAYVDYLLSNSRNVSITAVLTSVCTAYPEEVGECILPIFSVVEFYKWEQERVIRESSALSVDDNEISCAQEEMYNHNQLPHRQKYPNGLKDFIIDYQFNVRTLNEELFKIFDEFKKLPIPDIYWRKTLNEIDIRNWKPGEYDEKLKGFLVAPVYEPEVQAIVENNKPVLEEINRAAASSTWATRKFKNEKDIADEFIHWENAYTLYKENNSFDMYDVPAAVAHIGLRDYKEKLTNKQTRWCVEILVYMLAAIKEQAAQRFNIPPVDFSPLNHEPCLKSFSYLLEINILSGEEKREIEKLLFDCLISPIAKHDKTYLIEDYRERVWSTSPEIADRIWRLLVNYAAFSKTKPMDIEANDFSFDTHSGKYLVTAVCILPYHSKCEVHQNYIQHFYTIFTEALYGDFRLYKDRGRIQIDLENEPVLRHYLANVFLLQDRQVSHNLLEKLLSLFYQHMQKEKGKNCDDIYKFIKSTLEYVICEVDAVVFGKQYKGYTKETIIANFWSLWDFLYEKITATRYIAFSPVLFLGISWNETHKDWLPLKGKKQYYRKIVSVYGPWNIIAILKVFNSIGQKELLPDGLNWLVEILKQNPDKMTEMLTPKGNLFIQNMFDYFCLKIKNDKTLLKNYLWLLDNMIDAEAPLAYLLRENVITYKK